MKHLKLLIAAIAAMTSLSVNAQLTNGTVYWIQDASTGEFISQGANWGTQATVKDVGGIGFEAVLVSEGKYKLQNVMWNKGNNASLGLRADCFCDQASAEWELTPVEGGYLIHVGGANYLTNNGDVTSYGVKRLGRQDDASAATVWRFLTKAEYDAALQAKKDASAANIGVQSGYTQITSIETLEAILPTAFIGKDVTSSITNPTLGSNWNGWTHGKTYSERAEGAGIGQGCAEFWNGCGYATQTVSNLANGLYKVEFVGTFRPKASGTAANIPSEVTSSPAYVYANDDKLEFLHWIDVPAKADVRGSVTKSNGYGHTMYTYVNDGTLKLGVVQDAWYNGYSWCPFGQFTLTYYSDQVEDADVTALIASIPAEGTVPSGVYTSLTTLKNNLQTSKTITNFNALQNAIADANGLVAPYTTYKAKTEDAQIVGVANEIISAKETAVADATTVDAIQGIVADLQTAIDAITSFDITQFTITNPTAQTKDGWEGTDFGNKSNNVCEYWNQSGADFHQTIHLPAGNYRLTVVAMQRAGRTGTVYAGEKRTIIAQNGTINDRAAAADWFNDGNGRNFVYFKLEQESDVTIGLTADATISDYWTVWQSFQLDTYNEDVAIAYLAPGYTVLVNEAQIIYDNNDYTNVIGTERTTFAAAIAATPSTVAEYEAAVTALENAQNAFVAAKTNYDALVREILKAKALGMADADVDVYAATTATTAATALANTQALKVDEYNFVTTNYAYPVALSDNWASTGTNTSAATFNNEHWSGETHDYKNQKDGTNPNQGWQAGSWSLDFNQDVTLPAGSYVFKVAGRRSTGNNITMSLVVKKGETVLGTVSDFPQSNNTRGINKDGATAYDGENSEFANSGNGFGWEWRYVKFDLNDVATVNIGVSAVATASHQWISFGDYTLQATNEDVAALLEALAQYDAALTAANNAKENADYVNVKGSELKALNDAIGADATLDKSTLATVQAAITTLTNATTTFAGAKNSYDALVAAKAYSLTKLSANIGTGVFQYNATTNNDLFSAYETAKGAVDAYDTDDETSTAAAAQALVEALDEAIENYENQPLNAPAVGTRYNIVVATPSHAKLNNAVVISLGATGDNNPTGYSFNASAAPASYLAQAATFTQVSGNTYNISFETAEGTVYMTYGSLNGSQAGWADSQIQGTTDSDKKGEFLIQATTTENVFNIVNTINNTNIDCQDGGSIYTDVNITKEAFTLAEAQQAVVPVAIAADKYATRIFPFVPVIDGVTFYSCEATEDGTVLELVEVATPQANVPYILKATDAVNVELSGWGLAAADTYTTGWLTGVYAEKVVPEGSYVLQTLNGVQAFYAVSSNDPVNAPAYRAYLTAPVAAPANAFFFDFNTTGINAIDALTNGNAVIYDLQGRRVNKAEKGIYIVNGKKVVVK